MKAEPEVKAEPETKSEPEQKEPEKADDDFEEQKKKWEEKLAIREAALAAKEQELQTKGSSMSFYPNFKSDFNPDN